MDHLREKSNFLPMVAYLSNGCALLCALPFGLIELRALISHSFDWEHLLQLCDIFPCGLQVRQPIPLPSPHTYPRYSSPIVTTETCFWTAIVTTHYWLCNVSCSSSRCNTFSGTC